MTLCGTPLVCAHEARAQEAQAQEAQAQEAQAQEAAEPPVRQSQGSERARPPDREADAGPLSAQLRPPTASTAVAPAPVVVPQTAAPISVTSAPTPPPTEEGQPPRFWRMPRVGTQRPLTLPQGVMTFTSTTGISIVETAVGRSTGRANTFLSYSIGAMDDWELGLTLPGLQYFPPAKILDPSLYTRVRLLSGEVQVAVRAEITAPVESQGSAWMGLGADLAWSPEPWFRLETAVEYGLRFSSPLQQTIYVPVRALFSAGPNTWSLGTGVVMYNDADDFDVPLIARWAVAIRGYQGPLSEAAIEGGVADLTGSEGWFIRGTWTFFAYP